MRCSVPPPRRVREPTAPLIDVVFLLLIFFMLVGVIAPPEPFPVEPPAAERASAEEGGKLTILLAADGRLAFEGMELDLPTLQARLGERLAEAEGREAGVELKADATVDSGQVIAVLNALRAAGVERLALLTVRRRS
ncbi:MAG: biopolymer transporter ExbD [Candidatus Competibacteraceae bacterium]|nr:biopolymer transporter ExbD [Candidatus Competibacteraceae bacterium]